MSERPYEEVQPNIAFLVGPTHPDLGNQVASLLGVEPIPMEYKRFPDTEQYTRILTNVRDQIVIPFNTHAPVDGYPISDSLYWHYQMIDAAARSTPGKVIAVAPNYAGARQDRQVGGRREAVSAVMNLEMIRAIGCMSFFTVDIHDRHVLDNFPKPGNAEQFTAQRMLAQRLGRLIVGDPAKYVMISPDKGHKEDLEPRAKMLGGIRLEALSKKRDPDTGKVTHDASGIDVAGCTVLMMDDQLSTGDTHISASEALEKEGAGDQYLAVTHAWFLKNHDGIDAAPRLQRSHLKGIFVTDTLPISSAVIETLNGSKEGPDVEILSSAEVISTGLKTALTGGSVADLDPQPEED